MRFDEYFDAYDAKPALPLLPESPPDQPHVGTIVSATERRVDFDWAKSEQNRDGICIVIGVDVDGFAPFEVKIPAHYTGKVSALCNSARVRPPMRGEDWDEKSLIGCTVTFESVVAVSKRGAEYVRVNKWIGGGEPPQPVAKPKPAARTPLQKADKAASKNDDIPF